jgi:hypothetical protein
MLLSKTMSTETDLFFKMICISFSGLQPEPEPEFLNFEGAKHQFHGLDSLREINTVTEKMLRGNDSM